MVDCQQISSKMYVAMPLYQCNIGDQGTVLHNALSACKSLSYICVLHAQFDYAVHHNMHIRGICVLFLSRIIFVMLLVDLHKDTTNAHIGKSGKFLCSSAGVFQAGKLTGRMFLAAHTQTILRFISARSLGLHPVKVQVQGFHTRAFCFFVLAPQDTANTSVLFWFEVPNHEIF